MIQSEKVRENRVRLQADRQGFRLARSRRRDPAARDFGTYSLLEVATDAPVLSAEPLARVEAWLAARSEHARALRVLYERAHSC
jgi:hypothetical protein